MEKKDIRSYTLEELKKELESIGEKPFRSKQIYMRNWRILLKK